MPRKVSVENIARRKEQIMKAAITAFARTGLKGTSMNDIVHESGMSKGAIYWYYKSKDEIIAELLNEFFDPNEIKRIEQLLSSGTARERIDRFVDYIEEAMKKIQRFRPVIQELYAIAFRDQKIKKMVKRDFFSGVTLLQSIIKDGVKNKEFKRVDPYQVTLAIYQIIEGAALFWSLGIEIDFEKQLRGGVKLILEGIKAQK